MPMHRIASVLMLAALPYSAGANHHILYECVDANGTKLFTNVPVQPKSCKVLSTGPFEPPVSPAGGAARSSPKTAPIATPASFPRVDRETQLKRDSDRRRILDQELGSEQKLLEQARKELAEQESVRLGTERNYQRVLDRLEPYKKRVKLHEDNVANLKRELANVR
ncbi:MAG TPA: DUF4124 domain-containing protein [Burkholderiales bacterium]|nr:DUF4124 domain-containing protein [Burkholderiales bacterium]